MPLLSVHLEDNRYKGEAHIFFLTDNMLMNFTNELLVSCRDLSYLDIAVCSNWISDSNTFMQFYTVFLSLNFFMLLLLLYSHSLFCLS